MIEAVSISKCYRNGTTETKVLDEHQPFDSRGLSFCFWWVHLEAEKARCFRFSAACCLPTREHFELFGQNVRGMSAAELTLFRRQHLGFVFQRFHLFRGLTAKENVRVPLDLSDVERPAANRQAKDLLESGWTWREDRLRHPSAEHGTAATRRNRPGFGRKSQNRVCR